MIDAYSELLTHSVWYIYKHYIGTAACLESVCVCISGIIFSQGGKTGSLRDKTCHFGCQILVAIFDFKVLAVAWQLPY